MIEGPWISIRAKYKRGDGQFIVAEISFLSDSDCR